MCLVIDRNIHLDLVPKTSKSHILVRKALFKLNDRYITPYIQFPVKFNIFGIAKLEYKYYLKPTYEIRMVPMINDGIHSYTNFNYGTHIAIIPAKTSYFKGCNDDIVSNKLIIFKNEIVYKIWKLLQFRKVISL